MRRITQPNLLVTVDYSRSSIGIVHIKMLNAAVDWCLGFRSVQQFFSLYKKNGKRSQLAPLSNTDA